MSPLPPLVHLASEDEYRQHYERFYCQGRIWTFDDLRVYFPRHQFEHAFFESVNRRIGDKALFSRERAERIDWIRAVLEDPTAELYVGWDNKKKVYTRTRRVALAQGDYLVVVLVRPQDRACSFITAYPTTPEHAALIRSSPHW